MHRPAFSAYAVFFTLLSAGCLLSAETLNGRVLSVADGDTLTLYTDDGRKERVRLWGIDAPERDQKFGTQARTILDTMVRNKTVRVESEERDDYGRVVGTVHLKNRNINLELVKQGAAWHYKHYAPDDKALAKAELAARKAHAGLWKDSKPTPPWDFRHDAKPLPAPESAPQTAEDPAESGTLSGKCTRVTDGDTLALRLPNGKTEKIQLFGIDAPEPGQEYGDRATAALEALALGKELRVEAAVRDEFGRMNGKVYAGGQYLNLILVQQGHAWHSDKYAPAEEDLRAAHQEARAARRGLWANAAAEPPWRFRKAH